MPKKPRFDQGLSDAIVYRVCDLFLSQERQPGKSGRRRKVEEIAQTIEREFGETVSRETIYPMLTRGRELGFIRLVPPVNEVLAGEVANEFGLSTDELEVVNVHGRSAGAQVAAAGAQFVMDLARDMWARKPLSQRDPEKRENAIRLGLGPGRAALDFARAFSRLMVADTDPIPFELIAITAGAPADEPEYAPPSFFNVFPKGRVYFVGFFGGLLVPADRVDDYRKLPGAREAFEKADEIDIVITAMGDPKDKDDLLTKSLTSAREVQEELTDVTVEMPDDWKGNVQYRPYTDSEPYMEQGNSLRALTVFELEDFCEMANDRKRHVVLLARQCGLCGRSRADSLRPLLTQDKLKVWSHLVMDIPTARELLDKAQPHKANED
jgi:hypothetical protein